jgi:predicted metalloprotease with PDZ domain
LWVSEGITDYYGGVSLTRGGVLDSTAFFGFIANEIAQVGGAPPTAVSDASFDAWIAPTDGSGGLYYPKGCLTGFLLDILIRDASNNRGSLDQVMRRLYETTYKRGRGFTPAEWWGEVSHAAGGKSFTEFARRYVDGREPLPVDSVLRLAGLQARTDTTREPRLGIQTATDTSGVAITQLSATGAAAAAGARLGDRIVSIGDLTITNDDSFAGFRSHYAGTTATTLPLVVRRAGQTVTLQMPVRLVPSVNTTVTPIPNAPEKAVRIRNGIMRGSTS